MEQESLSLAWVKHDESWILAFLDPKSRSELRLCRLVEITEIELDSTGYFGSEALSNTVQHVYLGLLERIFVLNNQYYAKSTIFFQANIVSRVLGHLRDWPDQPWLGCATSLHFVLLGVWINENLRMDVQEFENLLIVKFCTVKSNWLHITLHNDE